MTPQQSVVMAGTSRKDMDDWIDGPEECCCRVQPFGEPLSTPYGAIPVYLLLC